MLRAHCGAGLSRALRLVLEWLDLHRDELVENWDLVHGGRPAKRIAPLE